MQKVYTHIGVGIDVSKSDFKVCMMGNLGGKQQKVISSTKFDNTLSGFKKFWAWVDKHLKKCVCDQVEYLLEATGVYHENLAWYLYEQEACVIVVLPNRAKAFFKSEGLHSKTDKIDAQGLAKMVLQKELKPWQPMSSKLKDLRSLTRYHETLQKEITQNKSRLEALKHSHEPNKFVFNELKKLLRHLENQKRRVNDEIIRVAQEDEAFYQKVENLTSIHGIGLLSALVIIAETNGFELFTSQKQLVSYAGYDVQYNDSGAHKGKTQISKRGNTHIRRILYMPALCAINKEGVFADLYQRVFERTKIKMKGYTAVQRKLLVMIYTLWKKNEEFDYNHQNNKIVEEQDALLH